MSEEVISRTEHEEILREVRIEECVRLLKTLMRVDGIITMVQTAHGLFGAPAPVIPGEGSMDPSTESIFESMDEWGKSDFMTLRRSVLSEIDNDIAVAAYQKLQQEQFGVVFSETAARTHKWMEEHRPDDTRY